jgi:hypothetical protein
MSGPWGFLTVSLSLWATFLPAIQEWVLGPRVLAGVGSMLAATAALAALVCFPSDQFGRVRAGGDALGMVGSSGCRRRNAVAQLPFFFNKLMQGGFRFVKCFYPSTKN